MRTVVACCVWMLVPLVAGAAASDQETKSPAKSPVDWQVGPGVAALKSAAEVKLPKGYRFANATDTQRMLKSAGEPVSGAEMGMILPEEGAWSVFFEWPR